MGTPAREKQSIVRTVILLQIKFESPYEKIQSKLSSVLSIDTWTKEKNTPAEM